MFLSKIVVPAFRFAVPAKEELLPLKVRVASPFLLNTAPEPPEIPPASVSSTLRV